MAVVVLTLVVKFSYPKIRQLSRRNHDGRSISRPPSVPASFVAIAIASAVVSVAHIHDSATGYQPNRELFGQGVATIASSLMGGMPATGAIARTSVNVRSQAKSRIVAITHAIFLLVVVLVLNPVISHVPTAALAAVLLGTSYRIAKPTTLKELLRNWVALTRRRSFLNSHYSEIHCAIASAVSRSRRILRWPKPVVCMRWPCCNTRMRANASVNGISLSSTS